MLGSPLANHEVKYVDFHHTWHNEHTPLISLTRNIATDIQRRLIKSLAPFVPKTARQTTLQFLFQDTLPN